MGEGEVRGRDFFVSDSFGKLNKTRGGGSPWTPSPLLPSRTSLPKSNPEIIS